MILEGLPPTKCFSLRKYSIIIFPVASKLKLSSTPANLMRFGYQIICLQLLTNITQTKLGNIKSEFVYITLTDNWSHQHLESNAKFNNVFKKNLYFHNVPVKNICVEIEICTLLFTGFSIIWKVKNVDINHLHVMTFQAPIKT